jgi:protein O-mannosyl-transferase
MRGRLGFTIATQAVAFIALACVVFGTALGHTFLLGHDDADYVLRNPALETIGWHTLHAAFTRTFVGNYAPAHILSYALDQLLWGSHFAGYVLENILLHAGNALLLSLLLFRLTGRTSWGVVAGTLFLLHPVQVESVVWVSQRKNVLSMLWSLLSLHAFLHARETRGRARGTMLGLSLVAFLCALLTKSAAVAIAPAVALLDRCDDREAVRRRWLRDSAPYVAMAALCAVVAIASQSPEAGGGRKVSFHGGSALVTFFTMLTVLPRYLGLVVYPADLSALYDPAVHRHFDGIVLGSLLLWIVLGTVGELLRRRARRLFFWYAFVFLALLPVSQVVPLVTLMNDRYLYFPMLGIAALVGAVGPVVVDSARRVRWFAVAAAVIVLCVLGVASRTRVAVWRDDITLWTDTSGKVPRFTHGWYNLGRAQQTAHNYDVALAAYGRVLALQPRHRDALINYAAILLERQQPVAARPFLLRAVEAYPDYCEAWYDLGVSWSMTGDDALAVVALGRAWRFCPDDEQVNVLLSSTYERLGLHDLAARHAAAASHRR